jgi:hypothetical protein
MILHAKVLYEDLPIDLNVSDVLTFVLFFTKRKQNLSLKYCNVNSVLVEIRKPREITL